MIINLCIQPILKKNHHYKEATWYHNKENTKNKVNILTWSTDVYIIFWRGHSFRNVRSLHYCINCFNLLNTISSKMGFKRLVKWYSIKKKRTAYFSQNACWVWRTDRWISGFSISRPRPMWFYNNLYNQCLSLLTLWVWIQLMTRCTRYNIMWWSLWVTCDRSVVNTNTTDCHDITEILYPPILLTEY